MNELPKLPQPINVGEHYLYGICIRLDALIHMMSNFIEVYAQQNNMATTSNQIEEKVETVKRKSRK